MSANHAGVDALVVAARAEENFAREELCRRIFRIAYSVAYRRFSFRREDAEDVAQEIVTRSLQKLYEGTVNASWIHVGATFLCIDMVRQRRTAATARELHPDELRCAGGLPSGGEATTSIDLRMMLERLPSRCARLLYQHFVEGRSFVEIDAERGDDRRRCQFEAKRCFELLLERAGRLSSDRTGRSRHS